MPTSRCVRFAAVCVLIASLLATENLHAFAQSRNQNVNCETPIVADASAQAANATPDVKPFDQVFIDTLIQHLATASSMGNLALQFAQDSDVRRVALRIVESQAGEIQLLNSWRSAWYPDAEPAKPVDQNAIATSLRCWTGTFDQTFLQAVIAHDQRGIELAQAARPHIEHDELKDFVSSYIDESQSEIRSTLAQLNHLLQSTPGTS